MPTPSEGRSAASDLLAVTMQCGYCDGDGYTEKWLADDEGREYPVAIPCDRCGGTGDLRADGEDDGVYGDWRDRCSGTGGNYGE